MSDIPKIANYEILREIGEGGYGKVYLAKLKNHDGFVALKVIASKGVEREEKALEKFLKISDRACMAEILEIGSSKDFLYYSSPWQTRWTSLFSRKILDGSQSLYKI